MAQITGQPKTVADTRVETATMLQAFKEDICLGRIRLRQRKTIIFPNGPTHGIEVDFEPVGTILTDETHVIIAYRDPNDDDLYGFGHYNPVTNFCEPTSSHDVVRYMAPGEELRIEERDLLARMVEILSTNTD